LQVKDTRISRLTRRKPAATGVPTPVLVSVVPTGQIKARRVVLFKSCFVYAATAAGCKMRATAVLLGLISLIAVCNALEGVLADQSRFLSDLALAVP